VGLEVAVAAVIWVSLKSIAHCYTHVRTSIPQGPEKKMKQTGLGIVPVCYHSQPLCDHMECSPGYRDGRKVVLESWYFAQPIAQRVQQAGQISLKYYLHRRESV
jgi:hypothetical protein